ncbi:MAG: tRNA lysidine(34) synthetase TilS [Methanotrichaceae archaeon]
MKCDKCSSPSAIYQKYSGMHLCTAHFWEDVHRKIRGHLRESGIFAHGAKLAAAVNGSAESAVMIYVLKSLFSNRKDIEFVAIMIDEGIAGDRHQALGCAISLASELRVPFVIKRFKDAFGVTMDGLHEIIEPCSICEPMRKDLLNRTAAQVGADALAVGSSLDSEAAGICFRYLRGDIEGTSDVSDIMAASSLSGISPDGLEKIPIIKPLRRIPAEEVRLYARSRGIRFNSTACPYARGLLMDVRKELRGFEERHPGTNYSLLRSIEHIAELRILRDEDGQSL